MDPKLAQNSAQQDISSALNSTPSTLNSDSAAVYTAPIQNDNTPNPTTALPETHELTNSYAPPIAENDALMGAVSPLPPVHEILPSNNLPNDQVPSVPTIIPELQETSTRPSMGEVYTEQKSDIYELAIIGGGPAAISAGIYAGRKELQTLLLADKLTGQSVVSGSIENWIGEPSISGIDLAKKLEDHLKKYSDCVDIKQEKVTTIKSVACATNSAERICDFELTTDQGNIFTAKSLIIASGARRRKLGVPGEDKFEGKGISFCSTCDGPLFKGKKVAVIGGGNAGFEAVHDLGKIATEIYVLDAGSELKADPRIQDEIKEHANLKDVILNAKVKEVIGDQFVTGIKIEVSGVEKVLDVQGVFVAIGSVPNSDIAKNLVQLDDHNEIMVNFQNARTSHPGVFAAGDVTNDPYKQNNIASGDGVRAALSAYFYLQNREKKSPAAE